MDKRIIRFLLGCIIVGYGILLLGKIGNIGLSIKKLQEHLPVVRLLLGIIGTLGAVGVFWVWGAMFYHWGTHVFEKKAYKIIWFLLMFFGIFIGSWFYYIFVFELGKTLCRRDDLVINVKINKKIFRFLIGNIILWVILFVISQIVYLINLSVKFMNFPAIIHTVLISWGLPTSVIMLFVWAMMLFHWGNETFKKERDKPKWFFLLVVLQWIGAIIYYFAIVDKKEY
ncbi:MAG: hypothetical protein ACETWK_05605 [Candidatus Aminicenantaceae bacterium]